MTLMLIQPDARKAVTRFAAQEQQMLLAVTIARAEVGSIQATPALINSSEALAGFQAARGEAPGAAR